MQGTTVRPTADGPEADRQGVRLVLVCAWCRRLLGPQERTRGELENFGICPRCLREQLSRVHRVPPA